MLSRRIRRRTPTASSLAAALRADRARALQLVPVSRETAARLDRYVELLLRWQENINLVAPSTLPALWTRHVSDSLQLLALAPDAATWIDLGSGAGFPGLAVACALAERAGTCVHLVESSGKKAAFLREAARFAQAPAIVHAARIEDFVSTFAGKADVVTARALAPLAVLLGLAAPLLERGAKGLFLKGQHVEAELTEASKYWSMQSTLVPSKTSPHGRIVIVHRVSRITV